MTFKSDEVFTKVQEGLKADPSAGKKIGGVYQFNVTGEGGSKKTWCVDLKSSPPVVKDSPAEKADCTITLNDADLVNMVSGKANGQQLFMQGKLKIQGNMAMAMKLDQLFKAQKPTSAGASSPAAFKSDEVFAQVQAGLKADPSAGKKVGGVYQFNVTGEGGAKKVWSVDLKAATPVVKDAPVDKPECTITLADNDLVNMVSGKANGQQLFMQGKLKIQGNMAMAMKLDQLFKSSKGAPAAATAAPAAAAAAGPKFGSDAVFEQIRSGLQSDPSLAKKVGGVYQFNVTGDGGAKKTWSVDLKATPPVVKDAAAEKPECTITIADADFLNMTTGKANGQQLFMQGKLKIQGNMALAMKLDQLVKKKASL